MGLAERIQRARAVKWTAKATTTLSPQQGFLPFHIVEAFLRGHSLFQAANPDIHKVHAYMTQLHAPPPPPPPPPPQRSRPPGQPAASRSTCSECGGYIALYQRGGEYSCVDCGLVASSLVFDRPFEAEPSVSSHSSRQKVVPYYVHRIVEENPEQAWEAVLPALEHWNSFVHFSPDELVAIARRMASINPKKLQDVHFVVAALLHERVKDLVDSEEQARQKIAQKRSLELAAPLAPMTFPCSRCGTAQGSAKAARYHCKRP